MRLRVKDFTTKVGSGVTPRGGAETYLEQGIPLFRSQNVYDNGFLMDDIAYISEEVDESMSGTRVKPGDVLLNITGASIGRCFYTSDSFERGNVNQHVCIIRPKRNITSPSFLHYCIISNEGQEQINLSQTGANREGLSVEDIKGFSFDIPSLSVQQKMVDYLDEKTSAIDTQVELLEKKKDAYARLKKAMINRAVTRGLDEHVKLKDSGENHIGFIPEAWEIRRLKEISTIGSGTTPSTKQESYYNNGTHPWINTGCVQDCAIITPADYITDKAILECKGLSYYPKETILLAMYGGGTIGNVGILRIDAAINQACCAINLNRKVADPEYYFYLLLSMKSWIISRGFGGTQVNLSQGQIANFTVCVPPYEEQQSIAEYLDKKSTKIDAAIANIDKQTDALKRLKRSLINEVITGQRAV